MNSAFGKTMESKCNRRKLTITRNENYLKQTLATSSLKSFRIIDEDMASITFNPTSSRWDKLTIIGAVILDLAECFM